MKEKKPAQNQVNEELKKLFEATVEELKDLAPITTEVTSAQYRISSEQVP